MLVGDVRRTVLPDAKVSHSPQRSFFQRLVTFLAKLSSSEVFDPGIWFNNLLCRIKRDTDLLLSLLYQRPASTWARFMASAAKICSCLLTPIRCRQDSPQQGQYWRLNSGSEFVHLLGVLIW